MADFRTVLTYSTPIDAEVDKSMLQSEGIPANLLNRDSSLNGIGGPFSVQLQVADEDFIKAADLIRSKRPERFGRNEGIADAEAAISRGTRRYCWFGASAICLIYALLLYMRGSTMLADPKGIGVAIVLGLFISVPIWLLFELCRNFTKRG
jgi:hypothetical protein